MKAEVTRGKVSYAAVSKARRVRCHAHLTDGSGRPCRRWACKGMLVCPKHGGSSPQAKRKAAERIARAESAAYGLTGRVVSVGRWAETRGCKLEDGNVTTTCNLSARDLAYLKKHGEEITAYLRDLRERGGG